MINLYDENRFDPDYGSPPGDTLKDILEELGVSQAELARRLKRPKKTINEIIKGKTRITPETALQLEEWLPRVSARFWLRREADYQLFLAKRARNRKHFEALMEQCKIGIDNAFHTDMSMTVLYHQGTKEEMDAYFQTDEGKAIMAQAEAMGYPVRLVAVRSIQVDGSSISVTGWEDDETPSI